MSSSSDVSVAYGGEGGKGDDEDKACTSYAQKVDNKDDVDNTSRTNISSIDAISDILSGVDISNDDDLFKDHPPKEDCPLCLLPMPYANGICGVRTTYMPCCGKMLCTGCSMAEHGEMKKGNIKPWCAFCRLPLPTSNKEALKRIKKRMKLNDARAYVQLGLLYERGDYGLTPNIIKSIELWNKASEDLGSAEANYNIAVAYRSGHQGMEKDSEKGIYHLKLAAIGGHEAARFNLGSIEYNNGNIDKSMKHGARAGYDKCLENVGTGYKLGLVTKDEYATTLRAYQVSMDEMKSKQRTEAMKHKQTNSL